MVGHGCKRWAIVQIARWHPSTNYFRVLPLSACGPAKEVLGNQ